MKVCDLTQAYAPTGGGVRTYVHAKRDFIARDGEAEHLLIVPGAEDRVIREGRLTTCMVAGPRVPGSPAYRFLLRSDKVLQVLRAERPDLIEVQDPYNLAWTAFYHRRRFPCPVVGAYVTDLPTTYVEPVAARLFGGYLGGHIRTLTERYLRTLYNRCDATLAISPALAVRLQEMGVRNVECIPLGVDLEVFHPLRRDSELRRRLGVAEDEFLLIYAGRLDWEKRTHLVVEAFEKLPADFPGVLVLVGEGPQREELAARAARNGRIHLLPFEPDRQRLAALLASADLYVSAMPFETFGLSVIEAQACGLPVVGVRGGAMIDRVPAGLGLLGRVDSPEDLAANILAVAGEGGREMGERARRWVEAEFSWERTFEQVLALYRRLLPAANRRTSHSSARATGPVER